MRAKLHYIAIIIIYHITKGTNETLIFVNNSNLSCRTVAVLTLPVCLDDNAVNEEDLLLSDLMSDGVQGVKSRLLTDVTTSQSAAKYTYNQSFRQSTLIQF